MRRSHAVCPAGLLLHVGLPSTELHPCPPAAPPAAPPTCAALPPPSLTPLPQKGSEYILQKEAARAADESGIQEADISAAANVTRRPLPTS